MKSKSTLLLIALILASASCQSASTNSRTDYSDASFDPLKPRIEDRAKFLRSVNPELSRGDAIAQASRELRMRERRAKDQREAAAAQRQFEDELSKSLEK